MTTIFLVNETPHFKKGANSTVRQKSKISLLITRVREKSKITSYNRRKQKDVQVLYFYFSINLIFFIIIVLLYIFSCFSLSLLVYFVIFFLIIYLSHCSVSPRLVHCTLTTDNYCTNLHEFITRNTENVIDAFSSKHCTLGTYVYVGGTKEEI
jgi:hypothetical protein